MISAMCRTSTGTKRALIGLAGTTALVLLLTAAAQAETRQQGCKLVNGELPEGCFQANEGQVVRRGLKYFVA